MACSNRTHTLAAAPLTRIAAHARSQAGCCADALAPISPPPPPAPAKPPANPKPLAPIAARPTNVGAVGAHGALGGDDRPGPVGQRGGGADIPPPTPPTPTGGAVDETSSAFSERSFTHVHGRSLNLCTPNNCGYCPACPTCEFLYDGSCAECCPPRPQPQPPPSQSFGPGNPFSAGLNRRCITCPASFRHLHPVNVLDSARRVRGAVLILVAGRARGGGRARAVSRGAAFPSGFLKKMLSWKAGSAQKSHDSPPVLV